MWKGSEKEIRLQNDKTEWEYVSPELQDVTAQSTAVFKHVKKAEFK